MGGMIDKLYWGSKADEEDPVTGMIHRDVHRVHVGWKVVYAKADVYGMEVFMRLFAAQPGAKNYFWFLKNMKDEDIRKSPNMKAHVASFMNGMNVIIVNLSDPEVAKALAVKLGKSHKKHGIPKEHFTTLREIMVDFLKKLASWSRFLDFMNQNILANAIEN